MLHSASGTPLILPAAKSVKISGCEFAVAAEILVSEILAAAENSALEIPEEELYWIEAAEEADRQGVDIISTSLGYNTFDDSKYNYTYADMNGQKSFIARGVNIASDKGIFVLIASGNEGNKTWHYITTQ